MLRNFIFLIATIFVCTPVAAGTWFGRAEIEKVVIVVIDDSTVPYSLQAITPMEQTIQGRLLLLDSIRGKYDGSYEITIFSLFKKVPIWSGRATDLFAKENTELFAFIEDVGGGCADFDGLYKSLENYIYFLEPPLEEVYFFSPLSHTGRHPCEGTDIATRYNPPPDEFFEWVKAEVGQGVKFQFLWLFMDAQQRILKWARAERLDKGLVIFKSPSQTLGALK